MIDGIASARTDSLSVRAQIGTVTIVADVYADVIVNGDTVPLVPIRPGLTVVAGDVVLIWRVGESWIVGEILPTEPTTLVPEGFIETTPVGQAPDGWKTYGTLGSGLVSASIAGFTVEEGPGHSGDRRLVSPCLGAATGISWIESSVFRVEPGDYFVGVFVSAASAFPTAVALDVISHPTSAADCYYTGTGAVQRVHDTLPSLSTEWSLLSGTFTVTVAQYLRIYVSRNETPALIGNAVYADDLLTRLT